MRGLEAINTRIFSKIRIVGQRECEKCGQKVNIIESDGKQVSDCLNCDSLKLQDEVISFKENADKRKAELIFQRYSLIPGDLLKATFSNYEPQNESTTAAKTKCEWYANHFGEMGDHNSLLLQGSYGLGKSHLAFSIAQRVKELGHVVIFITMPELLNILRDSYGKKGYSEVEIINACKDADLLVLDDMGAEYVKQDDGRESWAADKIFQIVNARMDKPNVFTTNLKSKELAHKYGSHGGRIVSRMMLGTRIVKFEGKDYRLKGW